MLGATEIEELTDAPGGGSRVTIFDPEGFPVNLVFGQEMAETGKLPEKLIYNWEQDKPREGAFQRFSTGPAAVHKVCSSRPMSGLSILTATAWTLWTMCCRFAGASQVLHAHFQPRPVRLPAHSTSERKVTR